MSLSIASFCRKVALFQSVEAEELTRIASLLSPRDVPKDAHVVTQDEPGDALYIIAKGRMKVVLYGDNGREVILTLLKTGDFFGEMALLDDLPRSANVIALADSRVLVLKREGFAEHIRKSPTTALNVKGGAVSATPPRRRDHWQPRHPRRLRTGGPHHDRPRQEGRRRSRRWHPHP